MEYLKLNTSIGLTDEYISQEEYRIIDGYNISFKDDILSSLYKNISHIIYKPPGQYNEKPIKYVSYIDNYGHIINLLFTDYAIRILTPLNFLNAIIHMDDLTRINQWEYTLTPEYIIIANLTTGLYKYKFIDYRTDATLLTDISISTNAERPIYGKYVNYFNDHLFIGYLKEDGVFIPQRLRWSGAGEINNYDYFTSDAGYVDLVDDSSYIKGLISYNDNLYIFKERSIVICENTGGYFMFKPIISYMGCQNDSIVTTPYGIVFLWQNKVYLLSEKNVLTVLSYNIDDSLQKLDLSVYKLFYNKYVDAIFLYKWYEQSATETMVYQFSFKYKLWSKFRVFIKEYLLFIDII